MSPEQQKYYDTYFDLFLSDGWKQFIKEVDEVHKYAIESTHLLEDSNEFFERKGNIFSYGFILNLPNNIKARYELETEEDQEIDDEEDV